MSSNPVTPIRQAPESLEEKPRTPLYLAGPLGSLLDRFAWFWTLFGPFWTQIGPKFCTTDYAAARSESAEKSVAYRMVCTAVGVLLEKAGPTVRTGQEGRTHKLFGSGAEE